MTKAEKAASNRRWYEKNRELILEKCRLYFQANKRRIYLTRAARRTQKRQSKLMEVKNDD